MNYSPAEVLRYYLISQGIGALPQPKTIVVWPISLSSMPEDGDNALCLYDTMGKPDGRDMRTGEKLFHPGFQIRIRATDYRTGYNKGIAIVGVLDAVVRATVAVGGNPDPVVNYLLHAASRTGDILHLGEEPERRRILWTLNGVLTLDVDF